MRILKKLDIYILRQFTLLFAGTFFICLFIFVMQFFWRYVDDLIGKGLPVEVWAKFFFYVSMTLVPISLPLALLLASLISFGNMGERLELLSMKAAGIPLVRIIRPVLIFSALVAVGSFQFQNVVGPESSKQLAALLWSTKQKSPEMEIPEGVFYSDIPGYNLYVHHKDVEQGMLYGIMIYTKGSGYDDMQIVLADSGRIQSTEDQMHLKLTLYDGERFRNMQNTGSAMDKATVPYMRETFKTEVDIIPFDNNFSVMDAELFNHNAQTKNLSMIGRGIDSINHLLDSTAHAQYRMFGYGFLRHTALEGRADSAQLLRQSTEVEAFDTLFQRLSDSERHHALRAALEHARTGQAQTSGYSGDTNRNLRIHHLEAHRKFTLSLACLLFFFIGAPLGAIIRKGGLGLPVVISVLIFILYYMINISGEKMGKAGDLDLTFGAWLSTMVLAPMGVWLTYKANQDSAVFNMDAYREFFRRLLGLRQHRHIARKDVILFDPDYERLLPELQGFMADCSAYNKTHNLRLMPSYLRIFFRYEDDVEVIRLSEQLEAFVLELANTTDVRLIGALNDLPILVPDAHTRPFRRPRLNMAAGIVLPVGLFFWLRIWRYRLRLWHDLGQLQQQMQYICQRIELQIKGKI